MGILHQGRLRYHGRIEEAYVIQVFGDSRQAAALLQGIGITAVSERAGLRVSLPRADLPAVIDRLAGRVRVGLVEPPVWKTCSNG